LYHVSVYRLLTPSRKLLGFKKRGEERRGFCGGNTGQIRGVRGVTVESSGAWSSLRNSVEWTSPLSAVNSERAFSSASQAFSTDSS